MKCSMCEKEIENYSQNLNQLKIDESHILEICQECNDKFIKWQQRKFTKLFPTRGLKKSFSKEQE